MKRAAEKQLSKDGDFEEEVTFPPLYFDDLLTGGICRTTRQSRAKGFAKLMKVFYPAGREGFAFDRLTGCSLLSLLLC